MRLTDFSVENYRSFVDKTTIELRPLTLLFGYNSAGKSAALRVLPLAAASTASGQPSPLALDSDAARGASFKDLLSRQTATPSLKIGFSGTADGPTLRVEFDIRDIPERQTQVVERVRVFDPGDREPEAEALWDPEPSDAESGARRYELRHGGSEPVAQDITFSGLTFETPRNTQVPELLKHASELIAAFSQRIYWLNSLRDVPPRSARFGPPPRRLSSTGANVGEFLAHDALAGGELVEAASAWFQRATSHRLAVRRYAVAGEDHFSIVLAPLGAQSGVEVPIVDTGEGMAQVLPVIVLGSLAGTGRLGRDPVLAIEHPELHLHPAAHADLASFFCDLSHSASSPTVVIETHSENFLLRVQRAIAAAEISPEHVVVHWVRGLEDGRSVVDTIVFDEAARPQGSGWPPGVFSEDTEQAKEILRLRRERHLT